MQDLSLRKLAQIADFINEKGLDVCSISETWLGNSSKYDIVCGELTPVGYKLVHVPRNTGRGGGVAVLYKTSMKCKKQKVDRYSSFELLELLLTTRCDSIRLCVVYTGIDHLGVANIANLLAPFLQSSRTT